MATESFEIEGTWEEIVRNGAQWAGHRVRLTVFGREAEPGPAAETGTFRPASGRPVLRHAGTWEGNDLQECLEIVHETRAPAEF